MSDVLRVLVVGRSAESVDGLQSLLQGDPSRAIDSRVVTNGHVDPLYGVDRMPDALILKMSDNWSGELDALCERPAANRPPLLVVGPAGDAEIMRMAMHAGARDFLTEPVARDELDAALSRIAMDQASRTAVKPAGITSFINAKGGSGATLLACNVAHIMAAAQRLKVALVDLDVQFASLPHYFDLQTRNGLLDAVENADHLDAVALEGFVTRHSSGLRLMSTASDHVVLPSEIATERLEKLIDLMKDNYQQVVFDLPRQIDHLTSTVLERSERVFVVLQQSLSHVRDATRLLGILHNELEVADDRVTVIVNRHQKNAPISIADMKKALRRDDLITIPNDYRGVTESINAGAPLYTQNRSAAISRALVQIGTGISGQVTSQRGLLSRALAGLRGN